MKKIIAISVMLVLIVGVAFADPSFGGGLQFAAKLLEGAGKDADDKPIVNMGGIIVPDCNTIFNVSWSGENAGGMMRFWSPPSSGTGRPNWFEYFAFAWWKPIDEFKFQIGQNADGNGGHAQIAGWGFNAEAQNTVAIDQWDQWGGYIGGLSKTAIEGNAGWFGGFNGFGVFLSVFPAQGFELNLGIPLNLKYDDGAGKEAGVVLQNSKIFVTYDIQDIGTIRLAVALSKDNMEADLLPTIGFAFYLSAIENIGLEVGGSFEKKADDNVIKLGVGFRGAFDDITLKARLGFDATKDNKKFGINLLPSYNAGSLQVFFNAGFGMGLDVKEAPGKMDWFVNPYIKVPANAGNFFAGIALSGNDDKDEDVKWAIPFGWQVYY